MSGKLVMFDVDGTLLDRESLDPLPGVEAKIANLKSRGFQLAACSNQGGVGLRHWLEQIEADGGDVDYAHLPTADEIERRYVPALRALLGPDAPLYFAFAYQSKRTGQWAPTPEGSEDDPRWQHEWRKPGPGMLLAAMAELGVHWTHALFVGDRWEDERAAGEAGLPFFSAEYFFQS